ncbi:MAG: NADH-quinone oxidoreductase subunit H [Candidatus Omnitrophota bacterium]|jgi:formate hydrogenlyase subunit 4
METLFIIITAPLVSGVIAKIKNNLRMRKGPGIFQPYHNLIKLFYKEEVVSKETSWIFRAAPSIILASAILAALLTPVFTAGSSRGYIGDFILIIFIFALGRFFLALAALDAGSAFGGMGSSREMFLSSLAEPAAIISILAVSLNAGTTDLGAISGIGAIKLSSIVAGISLLMVALAETSRIPVDNQETHLELTMIHEAMVLEYSGRSLGFIELASHIKQIVFFSLIANVVFPIGIQGGNMAFTIVIYILKILGIGALVGFIEVSMAKMRLFRAVDFLAFSFVAGLAAVVISIMGA